MSTTPSPPTVDSKRSMIPEPETIGSLSTSAIRKTPHIDGYRFPFTSPVGFYNFLLSMGTNELMDQDTLIPVQLFDQLKQTARYTFKGAAPATSLNPTQMHQHIVGEMHKMEASAVKQDDDECRVAVHVQFGKENLHVFVAESGFKMLTDAARKQVNADSNQQVFLVSRKHDLVVTCSEMLEDKSITSYTIVTLQKVEKPKKKATTVEAQVHTHTHNTHNYYLVPNFLSSLWKREKDFILRMMFFIAFMLLLFGGIALVSMVAVNRQGAQRTTSMEECQIFYQVALARCTGLIEQDDALRLRFDTLAISQGKSSASSSTSFAARMNANPHPPVVSPGCALELSAADQLCALQHFATTRGFNANAKFLPAYTIERDC